MQPQIDHRQLIIDLHRQFNEISMYDVQLDWGKTAAILTMGGCIEVVLRYVGPGIKVAFRPRPSLRVHRREADELMACAKRDFAEAFRLVAAPLLGISWAEE